MEKYVLRCVSCGKEHLDFNYRLRCGESHSPSLLRTVYRQKTLTKRDNLPGMFKFSDWLPAPGKLEAKGAPITYQSVRFAEEIGLSSLFISFSGYWPERTALMETCTFKELEAPATVLRFLDNGNGRLVVASAGNTARAFAQTCSRNGVPLCLVVPDSALESLWLTEQPGSCIRLIALGGNSDYADSIQLANRLSERDGFVNEGGAFNVARRDGMGVTVLDAVLAMGEIPDHYFQAVGSGTGAIAAWEANLRLIDDGRYGDKKMRLHLSQNYPFTPIYDSWQAGDRTLAVMDDDEAKRRLKKADAYVLSNRKPPYSIAGGVYDALVDTKGEIYSITNQELRWAGESFQHSEGVDICPPAAVAVASLIKALEQGKVNSEDKVLLNITGGGLMRLKQGHLLHYLQPDVIVDSPDADIEDILVKLDHKL